MLSNNTATNNNDHTLSKDKLDGAKHVYASYQNTLRNSRKDILKHMNQKIEQDAGQSKSYDKIGVPKNSRK